VQGINVSQCAVVECPRQTNAPVCTCVDTAISHRTTDVTNVYDGNVNNN